MFFANSVTLQSGLAHRHVYRHGRSQHTHLHVHASE